MRHFLFTLVAATLLSFVSMENVLGEEWSQWKGPNHDGKSLEADLLEKWPDGGPKLLWRSEGLGEGFANLAFWGDLMFTTGDFAKESYLLFLDRKNGKVLKKIKIGKGGPIGGYPGPKSTPATDGKYVYAVNQNGLLVCADVETGELVWRKSFYEDYGGKMPQNIRYMNMHWGYACSPILDEDRLVCMPGGPQGTVVALDKKTGKTIWQSKELTDSSPYCSVVPQEIEGTRQYLVLTVASIAGLDCETGKLLWQAEFPGKSIVCTDPIYEDGIAFATCAYQVGSYAYGITKKGNSFKAKELYKLKRVDNKHHCLMYIDGYVYSSTDRGSFVCLELKSGNIKWENRKVRGKAAVTFADGKLILRLENSGELILVKPNPDKYIEISRFKQPDRSDRNAWTYPLVVDKKMYVRDQGTLFCYDLSK